MTWKTKLSRFPQEVVKDSIWYYESFDGIEIFIDGGKGRFTLIPWRMLKKSLSRYEASEI